MVQIAIFASGAGSNAEKNIEGPLLPKGGKENKPPYKVSLIVSTKPEAGVLKIASKKNIPFIISDKE